MLNSMKESFSFYPFYRQNIAKRLNSRIYAVVNGLFTQVLSGLWD